MVNDINEYVVSAPEPKIIKPSTPSNVNDDLDHYKRSSSIDRTRANKRHSMTDTIPNAENCKEKAPITAGTHSGSDNTDKDNKPNNIPSVIPIAIKHHGNKGPSIGAIPTVLNASKRKEIELQFGLDESIAQEEEKINVTVVDHHLNSDYSLSLPQSVHSIQFDSFHRLIDEKIRRGIIAEQKETNELQLIFDEEKRGGRSNMMQ